MKKKIPANVQKIWTKTETNSAKMIIRIAFKSGKKKILSPVTIIRPSRMETRHLNILNLIVAKYGTSR